jgi:hypothetical protein
VSTIKSSAENLTLNADGANNDIIFQSNGSTKVTLDGQNSRLGIGTTSPTQPLHVAGNIYTTGYLNTAGSGTAGGVQFADGNLYMYRATDDLVFKLQGSEKLRIDSSGKVGIGTTSPSDSLEVLKSGGGSIRISETDDRYVKITGYAEGSANGSTMAFSTVQTGTSTLTERMRVNSSGFVGMGELSPVKALHITRTDSDCMIILNSGNTVADKQICFANDYGSGNTSGGNYWGIGIDDSENELNIGFDADSQASMGGADTVFAVNHQGNFNLYKDDDVSGSMVHFNQSIDGGDCTITVNNSYAAGSSTDERAGVMFSPGNGTAAIYAYKVSDTMSGANRDIGLQFWTQNSNVFTNKFQIDNSGTLLGTDTSIGSLSDERLKKDIEDLTYSLDTFKALRPRTFKWKNDREHQGDGTRRGFIAQEIEPVDDYWVSTQKSRPMVDQVLDKETYYTKDDELPEGKNIGDVKTATTYDYQYAKGDGSDYDLLNDDSALDKIEMIAKLGKKDAMYVSVIQQLLTKIETLETKVTALENA